MPESHRFLVFHVTSVAGGGQCGAVGDTWVRWIWTTTPLCHLAWYKLRELINLFEFQFPQF